VVGLCLAADAVTYTIAELRHGTWSAATSLPVALCNVAVLVAAVACWWPVALLVELTWFWGLAGTLQGLLTPDLDVGFPHLVFVEYVTGHAGVVVAALFLVVGMHQWPRPGAVPRVLLVSVAWSAVVGAVDALTGGNYMFLRRRPGEWTLLSVLGPWPWYLLGATARAFVLFIVLDLPFRLARRRVGPGIHPERGVDVVG
jgi:hypothetical integral membrane protein (TIGR02206 family)